MSRPLSLTSRLSLAFAAVSIPVFVGLGLFITMDIDRHFAMLDREVLVGKILLVKTLSERLPADADLNMLATEVRAAFVGHGDMAMEAVDAQDRLLFATAPLRIPQAGRVGAAGAQGGAVFEWGNDEHRYRAMSALIAQGPSTLVPFRIFVSIPLEHHERFVASFGRMLGAVMLAAAIMTSLMGWLAVRRGLAPLRLLRTRAASITAARLDDRLPVDAVPPELADLAVELNRMLARLEQAFRRLSEFSSDIAHELRTPISNLMTQTQVALSQSRSAAQYREVLESNAEEYERLARMISDMLFLAKAEHGLMLPSREPVALGDEVARLFEFYDALAEAHQVRLHVEGQDLVTGDRLMLRRALSNLLSNAVRHALPGGHVVVRIDGDESGTNILVENAGEPIAAADLPHLFERFYRADRARAHGPLEGVGLGLAITRAIVAAHGGTIAAGSADGLTGFRIHLPRAARVAGD